MSCYFLAGTGALKKSEFKNLQLFKLKNLNSVRLHTDHTHSLLTPLKLLKPTTMMSLTPSPTSADSKVDRGWIASHKRFCPSPSYTLMLCQCDSTMTAIFNTALCEVKNNLNVELTWQPTHPSEKSEILSAKAIQWQLCHGDIGRSDSVKGDEKYSKHYHYQLPRIRRA